MLAALCSALAVACIAASIPRRQTAEATQELARMSTLSARELARERTQDQALWQKFIHPLRHSLAARSNPRWAGMTADDIRRAGIDPSVVTVEDVVALKLLGAMAGVAVTLTLSIALPGVVMLTPALAFAGFIAPSVIIRRRRNARRNQMLRELPDLVALLKAFMTSGTTLEQALHLISTQQSVGGDNLLAEEVRHALSDYGLGVNLEEALTLMAQRTGVEDLEMLAAALAQGKRQGAGMERILRDQEAVVRMAQRNRVTAEASRVGTHLVGVLVGVYLPEFMVLIMIPLFYGIFLRAFS
jgi:tight adherence protein C